MRTVQLTFTFFDEQWEDFRKVCTLWGHQEPTFSNVCCCIKLLALRGAKDVLGEVETVDGLWKEVKRRATASQSHSSLGPSDLREEELKKMKE